MLKARQQDLTVFSRHSVNRKPCCHLRFGSDLCRAVGRNGQIRRVRRAELDALCKHVGLPLIHMMANSITSCTTLSSAKAPSLIACDIATPSETRHQMASATSVLEARQAWWCVFKPCWLEVVKSTFIIIVPETKAHQPNPNDSSGSKSNLCSPTAISARQHQLGEVTLWPLCNSVRVCSILGARAT